MVIPSVHVPDGGGGGGGGGGEEDGDADGVGVPAGDAGVGLFVGVVVGVVVGLDVAVGLADSSPVQVTLTTVALTASYSTASGAHETSRRSPAATATAPGAMAALGAGPTDSSPATAARTRLPPQVDGGVTPDSEVLRACADFMFPLVRTPTPVAPSGGVTRGRPCAPRLCNQIPPSTPGPAGAVSPVAVAADRSGARGSTPVKARVIIETRAGALSVATGRASPGTATRHQVASRRPRAELTESYAFVQPFIDTVDDADVCTEEISSVPAVVPAGSVVRAVPASAATNV
jgi:hypothetical protein